MRQYQFTPIILGLFLSPVFAQTPAAAPSDRDLDAVVVNVSGPGMWKVRKGENTLWVLGIVSPLPTGIEWNSAKVRSVIRRADAVIGQPGVTVGADIGFFGKLALAPSLLGVRNNPDGKRLEDVVSPALYTRWSGLKQRYIGRDGSVEKMRPIFAGMELYQEAMSDYRLRNASLVTEAVTKAVKERGLTPVNVNATLQIKNPKSVVKEFKTAQLSDLECFEKTLNRVDRDLPALSARADAWARGDVQALALLPNPELSKVCQGAMLGGGFAAKYGIDKLEAQARGSWINAAETSLARHRTTFAMLPMNEVQAASGLIAALAAKGYTVDPPGTGDDLPSTAPLPGAAPR